MEQVKLIDNPNKDFPQYSQQLTQYATELFEQLAKDSKIDAGQNKATCSEYYKAKSQQDKYKKSISTSRVLLIVRCVLCVFVAFICFFAAVIFSGAGRIISIILIIGSLGGLIGYLIYFNKKKKSNDEFLKKFTETADKYQEIASEQRRPLWNRIYPNRADELIRKVVPLIHIDTNFDINRYAYMVKKFGLPMSENDKEASVIFSKSGMINGNPFLILREKFHHDERKTYVGTRTVMVRRSYHDSKGNTHYTSSPEVLTAYHSEIAPFYDYSQVLIFGSEAAPDLTFSRQPVLKTDDLSNIKKIIKRNDKLLEKETIKQRNDTDPTTNFQKRSNEEFDSLFFARDRNNEVQFRLRFTPLAQINRLDLIKNSPYGDDFCFFKNKRLNYILTNHSLNYSVDFDCGGQYIFDFQVRRERFIQTRSDYFKSFYYQLAPIFCVPLYQQHKPFEYIYGREYGFAVSPYDHEARSNRVPASFLLPKGASTDRILKSKYIRSVAEFDLISVESVAYHATPQTILVPKTASDGNVYNVSVSYYTYSRVSKVTQFAVRKTSLVNKELGVKIAEDEVHQLISSIDTPGTLIYNNDEIIFGVNSGNQGLDNVLKKLSDILKKGENK